MALLTIVLAVALSLRNLSRTEPDSKRAASWCSPLRQSGRFGCVPMVLWIDAKQRTYGPVGPNGIDQDDKAVEFALTKR